MKKHEAEKDLGFLRIGSLNVRVKRTTEAFSHFLGVGNPEKIHKHWGSADNLHQGDSKRMPPPKYAPIKKRKSKRGQDFAPMRAHSLLEKRPVSVPEANKTENSNPDSDSDTAAGFGTTWQSTV
ncbi:Ankyrin repeat [Nesidiocoris tenuis]|uniref:Ankyrin repeat n=1 Tax=Nesidiocoris tenuis TaxID=355587 RepID=A0ABN7B2T8_9HEMI|nr:Ankyrin repeat [Nesidiocoris tenuis]